MSAPRRRSPSRSPLFQKVAIEFLIPDIPDDVRAAIGPEIRPNKIAIDFSDSTVLTENLVNESIEELRNLSRDGEWTRSQDVFDLLEGYTVISQLLGDFIVVMGLGALLIGGVGIMNTMIVMVRRRTTEIAAVKTFGLKGRQVGGGGNAGGAPITYTV